VPPCGLIAGSAPLRGAHGLFQNQRI